MDANRHKPSTLNTFTDKAHMAPAHLKDTGPSSRTTHSATVQKVLKELPKEHDKENKVTGLNILQIQI